MDSYYSNQASLSHFSGYYRQRGSGFGALARGIGRFALPLAKKYLLPAAKTIGKELIAQGTPEIMEVFKKRKTPRKAIKATVRKNFAETTRKRPSSATSIKAVQNHFKTKTITKKSGSILCQS